MRALAAEGVFAEDDAGRFGSTPVSERLTAGSEDCLMILGWRVLPAVYTAFSGLLDAVKTGDTAFVVAKGKPFYTYLDADESAARAYEAAMASTVAGFDEMCNVYDFSQHRCVVDVGGGDGSFLVCLLSRYNELRGILFDSPQVVAGADERLAGSGMRDRIDVVGGDALHSIPEGGDLYVTSTVLRCFDDPECARILSAIRRAASPGARILAFEQMIPDGPAQPPTAMLDLHTMVVYGGRDRTRDHYAALYEDAGFKLLDAIPAGGPMAGFLGEAI
jgi:ubiquinone/menaquinone biosynthesis C-methylase UbiE